MTTSARSGVTASWLGMEAGEREACSQTSPMAGKNHKPGRQRAGHGQDAAVNDGPAYMGAPEGNPLAGLRVTLRTHRPGADAGLIRRAYHVAARWHQGQTRRSGDPYITHPVKVATILAGLGADDQMLCAGILHDTLEDTPCTLAELRRYFGTGIATMVAGHTALSRISSQQARTVSQAMAAIRSTDTGWLS